MGVYVCVWSRFYEIQTTNSYWKKKRLEKKMLNVLKRFFSLCFFFSLRPRLVSSVCIKNYSVLYVGKWLIRSFDSHHKSKIFKPIERIFNFVNVNMWPLQPTTNYTISHTINFQTSISVIQFDRSGQPGKRLSISKRPKDCSKNKIIVWNCKSNGIMNIWFEHSIRVMK